MKLFDILLAFLIAGVSVLSIPLPSSSDAPDPALAAPAAEPAPAAPAAPFQPKEGEIVAYDTQIIKKGKVSNNFYLWLQFGIPDI
jgi:hypothetical protein